MVKEEVVKFAEVVRKMDPASKLLRAWSLTGGVSAQVTAIEVVLPGGITRRMVVRRHGPVDLAHNPHIARDEFKLLQILSSARLPVPAPLYLDESDTLFGVPYIVIAYVEGKTEFHPIDLEAAVSQMTAFLSRLHKLGNAAHMLSFLPVQQDILAKRLREQVTELSESTEEQHIRETLHAAWPFPHSNKSTLLHGDFWPGNVLWKDGRVAAVIDWEDARLGDPLPDLANSRLEILWAFGTEAMHLFTQQYGSLVNIDRTDLPYWDLWAALRPISKITEWAADASTEKAMRDKLTWFISQAFESLSSSQAT